MVLMIMDIETEQITNKSFDKKMTAFYIQNAKKTIITLIVFLYGFESYSQLNQVPDQLAIKLSHDSVMTHDTVDLQITISSKSHEFLKNVSHCYRYLLCVSKEELVFDNYPYDIFVLNNSLLTSDTITNDKLQLSYKLEVVPPFFKEGINQFYLVGIERNKKKKFSDKTKKIISNSVYVFVY